MKSAFETLFIIIISFNCYSGKELPPFVKKCKQADPELSKCLTQRIEDIRPRLVKGIPEMKLPKLEPLRISKMEIKTGNGNEFNAVFTDIDIYGVKDFQVKNFEIDFENMEARLHFYFPNIRAQVHYSFSGKMLIFELNSSGVGYINTTYIDAKARRKFIIEPKNGKHYGRLADDYSYDLQYGKVNVYFENLFSNQQLTEETNKAINDNFEEIKKEIEPILSEAFIVLFSDGVQNLHDDYALEELYD